MRQPNLDLIRKGLTDPGAAGTPRGESLPVSLAPTPATTTAFRTELG